MPKSQVELDEDKEKAAKALVEAEKEFKKAEVQHAEALRAVQEAAALAEGARETTDELERELVIYKKWVPEDSERELYIKLAEEAALESELPILTEEEKKRAGEEWDKRKKSIEDKIKQLTSQVETSKKDVENREKTLQQLEEKFKAIETTYKEKKAKHWTALKDAAVAEELAALGEKKRVRYLAWDGSYGIGKLNTVKLPDPGSAMALVRQEFKKREQVLAIPAEDGSDEGAMSATIFTPSTVSVRIKSCEPGPFAPIKDKRAAVAVEFKRTHLIESMMFRVLDKNGVCVYQEVLDAAHFDSIEETQAEAEAHPELAGGVELDELQARYKAIPAGPNGGFAQQADGPYKFRVWVSSEAAAFDGLAMANDPVEVPGKTVSDQSKGKSGNDKALPDALGVNQTSVKNMKLVSAALLKEDTKLGTPSENINTQANKILNGIKAANVHFGAVRPHELRVFIGPEWFFQKKAYPHALTPIDKATVENEVTNICSSADGAGWLVFPGTALYAVPLDHGRTAVLNVMMICDATGKVYEYHKRAWGGDTDYDGTYRLAENPGRWDRVTLKVTADGNERRKVALNKSRMPESLQKAIVANWTSSLATNDRTKVTVTVGTKDSQWNVNIPTRNTNFSVWKTDKKELNVSLREVFITGITDATTFDAVAANTTLTQADVQKQSFFEYGGLKLAIEICADHKRGMAPGNWVAGAGRQFPNAVENGVDLHVVSSHYVDLQDWKSVARQGGFILQNDGNTGIELKSIEVQTRRETIDQLKTRVTNAWQAAEAGNPAPTPKGALPTTRMLPFATDNDMRYVAFMIEIP
ncbi:MAG: hypothetical protein JST92_11080 [Deltaproteobacteria bacterium]|nr:hypothetical protein [Deltaproteobacteria bacterium]